MAQDAERERAAKKAIDDFNRSLLTTRVQVVKVYKAGGEEAAVSDAVRRSLQDLPYRIASMMTALHLKGAMRKVITARRFMGKPRLTGYHPFDVAAEIARRIGMSDAQILGIRNAYRSAAQNAAQGFIVHAETALAASVRTSIGIGEHVRAGTARMRETFKRIGVAPTNPFAAEALFRTQSQIAYSAGRWKGNQDPAIDEIVWGYEYVSVMDNRTTPFCEACDGIRQPKWSPFWQRYMPPNHWNCRASMVEIFFGDPDVQVSPIPEGLDQLRGFDEAFAGNFAEALAGV